MDPNVQKIIDHNRTDILEKRTGTAYQQIRHYLDHILLGDRDKVDVELKAAVNFMRNMSRSTNESHPK